MTCVFCGIGIADNHPATLRHQHEALKSPAAAVKEALDEFACEDFRNEAQASGSAKSMGTKVRQLASRQRDSFFFVTDKCCLAADLGSKH